MILTPAVDELVGHLLRRGRRNREHRDDDVLVLDHLAQLGVVPHGQRADLRADLLLVDVEHRDDPEPVVGEDVGRRDRRAEVAGAEQRDVVLAGGPQDLPDLGDERLDVVADAPLAELAEAGEITPDLRRVDVRVVRELLRGDRLLAHLPGLRQDLEVARQPCRDAKRQLLPWLFGTRLRVFGTAADRVAHPRLTLLMRLAQPRHGERLLEPSLVDEELEQLDAVDRHDRDPLQVGGQQPVVLLDVALAQREPEPLLRPDEHLARVVAQTTARTPVEHDRRAHAASARSPVA